MEHVKALFDLNETRINEDRQEYEEYANLLIPLLIKHSMYTEIEKYMQYIDYDTYWYNRQFFGSYPFVCGATNKTMLSIALDFVESNPYNKYGDRVEEKDTLAWWLLTKTPCKLLNVPDTTGETALIKACRTSDIFIEKIIDIGADITATDETGRNALMWYLLQGKTELVPLLLNDQTAATIDNNGQCVFIIACGHISDSFTVQQILDATPTDILMHIDTNNKTTLCYACENKQPQIALAIIKRTNICDKIALYYACKYGYQSVAVAILKRVNHSDVDVLCIDEHGKSIMDYAVAHKMLPVIATLAEIVEIVK